MSECIFASELGNFSSERGFSMTASMLARLPFILLLLLWASSAVSSQLGNGLLGYALYGGSSTPEPPTVQSVNQVALGLEVTFTPPTDTGGYPVSGYQYSLDETTWFDVPDGVNVFVIPSSLLSPGVTATVYLRSVSAAGASGSNTLQDQSVPVPVPVMPVWLLLLSILILVTLPRYKRGSYEN